MPEFPQEIVTRFITNGDESSFSSIFHFFYPRLFHFVRAYVPNDDLAEDLVQDTFLSLWNKRESLSADSHINAWLYTVARNICLKKLRDNKTEKTAHAYSLNDPEPEMNVEALAVLDISELTFLEIEDIIRNTFETLPPQCKKIFELSRFGNKKNRDIAENLDISIKAVENQITKALKAFRSSLKDYLPLVACLFI